jgi:hypothetical protein
MRRAPQRTACGGGLVVALALLVAIAFDRGYPTVEHAARPASARASRQDAHFDPCHGPLDANSSRFQSTYCNWQFAPVSRQEMLPFERRYAEAYMIQQGANIVDYTRTVPQKPPRDGWGLRTRNLSRVSPVIFAGQGAPNVVSPVPVLVTTVDYMNLTHHPRFELVYLTLVFEEWEGVKNAAAVDAATGMYIDISSKQTGYGHGMQAVGSKPGTLEQQYFRLLAPAMRAAAGISPEVSAEPVVALPKTRQGYLWAMGWFMHFPGHCLEDLTNTLANHRMHARNATLILPDFRYTACESFLKWLRGYYAVDIVRINDTRIYATPDVSFAPVMDMANSPGGMRFIADVVYPQLNAKHRRLGTTTHKKIALLKMGSEPTEFRPTSEFTELLQRHGFIALHPANVDIDTRAYLVSNAELALISWGGTQSVTMFTYGRVDRPLRLIIACPPSKYLEELYHRSLIGAGRLQNAVWYVWGFEVGHQLVPSAKLKSVLLNDHGSDRFTDDHLVFHDDAFELRPEERRFLDLGGWTQDTGEHLLRQRRMMVYNYFNNANVTGRGEARTLLATVLRAAGLRVTFARGCQLSSGYHDFSNAPAVAHEVLLMHTPLNGAISSRWKGGIVALAITVATGHVVRNAGAAVGLHADSGETGPLLVTLQNLSHALGATMRGTRAADVALQPRLGKRLAYLSVGCRPLSLSEGVQAVTSAVGYHILHGHDPRTLTMVLPPVADGEARRAMIAVLRMHGADHVTLPAGIVAILPPDTLFSPPVVPFLFMLTATSFLASASLQRPMAQSELPQRRIACLLTGSSRLASGAARVETLIRQFAALGVDTVVDAAPRQAHDAVNSATTIIVPYGDEFLYYLSFWGGVRRLLRVVVLCFPLVHQYCITGHISAKRDYFYSNGAVFASRNIEVMFVLAAEASEYAPDARQVIFDGIPSLSGLENSTWQRQSAAEISKVKDMYEDGVDRLRRQART